MTQERSSLHLLRNNAKTIGGLIGAEMAFLEGKLPDDTYFLDKGTLKLQDLSFA